MKVHVSDLQIGDCLSHDTFNAYGLHVLSKGTILQEKEISRLFQHQIEYVDIVENGGELEQAAGIVEAAELEAAGLAAEARTLESTLSPKWLPTVKPLYENAIHAFGELFSKVASEERIDMNEVEAVIGPLFDNLQMERDVVSLLLLLNTSDDYTYQHSVQVGMLSYYLAVWMGYTNEEALHIGKAGFLHDIGKSKIGYHILNKPGKLTDDEFDEIKKHPGYGHDIIVNSIDDEKYAAIGALQHHERNDGSGYPHGLSSDEIHPVAKIIAVVDIYSAMISQRVYQDKRDLLYVLRELYRLSFEQLDPQTTHTFIKHMIPNFIGKRVELESGESGIIVMTHPSEFFRPLIRVDGQFIDMSIEREYEIKHVYL